MATFVGPLLGLARQQHCTSMLTASGYSLPRFQRHPLFLHLSYRHSFPAPEKYAWQQSPGWDPPGVPENGGASTACGVCSVTTDRHWQAAGRQSCTGAEVRWTPDGEVEGDPFLEMREAEKTEELTAGSWLTLSVGEELLSWTVLHPSGSMQIQQHLLLSREPLCSQNEWYPILFQGREIESLGCCVYQAWSCLGDART